MDNQFSVQVPNALQALMLGEQSYKDSQLNSGRQRAGRALAGGDYQNALAALMGAGSMHDALAVAGLANSQRDYDFRRQESQRSQANTDRQFALTEKQAEEKPQYQTVEGPDGTKHLVKIDPYGRGASVVNPTGMAQQPPSPYSPTGKITGDEAKDRLFVNRMVSSHNIINGLETINDSKSGAIGGYLASHPGVRDSALFNVAASPDRQKSIQAQRDFVNAVLRKESGAAINASEFENAQRQYFPMPGDTKDVIAQKRQNRMLAIEGMMAGAGKGYQPPAAYVGTKGPAQPQQNDVIAQARSAIAAGAPRDAVIQRLKQNGHDATGI